MSTPSDQFKTIADTLSNLKRVLLLDDEASQSVKRAYLSSGNSIVCPSLEKRREEEVVAVRDQKGENGLQKEEVKSGSDSPRNQGEESRNGTCEEPGVACADETYVRSIPTMSEKSVIEVPPFQPQVVVEEPVTPPEEVEVLPRESGRPPVQSEESSENQPLSPRGSSAFPTSFEFMPKKSEMSSHSESVPEKSETSTHAESIPEASAHSASAPETSTHAEPMPETSTHSASIPELPTPSEPTPEKPTLPLDNAAVHIDLSQEGVEPKKPSPLTLEERMEQVLDAMEHQIACSESVHSAFKPPHIIPQPAQPSNTPSLRITHIQFIYINHRGCAVGALPRSHG